MRNGERVQDTGFMSGEMSGTVISSLSYLTLPDGYNAFVLRSSFVPVDGDSGGSVYTTPNGNDEVEFVGIILGVGSFSDGRQFGAVTPWTYIQYDLGLVPIF